MTYYCENEKIIGRETIQQAIEKLPETFIQTHKSYIVNMNKVKRYDNHFIFMNGIEIPISDSFSQTVFSYLKNL